MNGICDETKWNEIMRHERFRVHTDIKAHSCMHKAATKTCRRDITDI
jgi:hypothetical protein